MSNQVTIFTTPADLGSLDVRIAYVDVNRVWRLDDVCAVLEIADPWTAARRLDEDEKITLHIAQGNRGNPNVTFVTEAGLYSLILTSRSPRAKAFKRWVTHEVLPSLRQHGIYVVGQERVRTGEMSISELRQRAAESWKSLAEALDVQNGKLTQANTTLAKIVTLVSEQTWKGLRGFYWDDPSEAGRFRSETPEQWRGMLIWASRSCEDCSNGRPCRPSGQLHGSLERVGAAR